MSTSIEKLTRARQELMEAKSLDDILKIRDIAEAARVYARAAQLGLESQNEAAEIKMRAEIKAGELLAVMKKADGQLLRGCIMQPRDETPTYADLGIEKTQAHRWQTMAKIPEAVREKIISVKKSSGKELTSAEMYRVGKSIAIERDRAARAELGTNTIMPDAITVCYGDGIAQLETLPDNSIHLIFTDPPYDEASIQLYGKLAEIASRKLIQGGSLVAYAGHYALPRIFEAMCPHLRFWWLIAIEHGGQNARLIGKNVMVHWKPAVWFVKEKRINNEYVADMVKSKPPTKADHDWQQDTTEAEYYIKYLTEPWDLVADPFMGSGTTLVAALNLNRRAWGCDIDEQHVNTARARISKSQSNA